MTDPGYKTTEFWLNVLILVGTFTLVLLDKIDPQVWMLVSGAQGVGYAASRAYAKANAPLVKKDRQPWG